MAQGNKGKYSQRANAALPCDKGFLPIELYVWYTEKQLIKLKRKKASNSLSRVLEIYSQFIQVPKSLPFL